MSKQSLIMLLIISICFIDTLQSQNTTTGIFEAPFFLNITKKDGFLSKAATAINQDNLGFVWIGSNNGLYRYDGKKCVRYLHNQEDSTSIHSSYINSISPQKDGSVWIAGIEGLDRYIPQTNSFEHYLHFLKGQFVKEVLVDEESKGVWVGTLNRDGYKGGGLHFISEDKKTIQYWKITDFIPIPNNLYFYKYNSITSIKKDKTNSTWLWVSVETGIALFDISKQKFINFWEFKNIQLSEYQYITSILPQKDGSLWVGVWDGGLFHFFPNENRWVYVEIKPEIDDKLRIVTCIYEKNENELLIGSQFGVISLQKPNLITDFWEHRYNEPTESPVGYLTWQILVDKDQTPWFAMENGVSRLDFKHSFVNFFRFNPTQKLNTNICQITGIAEDPKSRKIYATIDAGENLYILDCQRKSYQIVSCFPWKNKTEGPRYFEAISTDISGKLWLISQNQIFTLESGSTKIVEETEINKLIKNIALDNVQFIKLIDDSVLWLISKNKVVQIFLNENQLTENKLFEKFGFKFNETINDALFINKNEVLLATSNGFFYFKNGKWKHQLLFNQNENISLNHISSLTKTPDNYLWLTIYNQGLVKCQLENGNIKPIKTQNGKLFYLKEFIYQIKYVSERLWMITANGLVSYNYTSNTSQIYAGFHNLSSLRTPILSENKLFVITDSERLIFSAVNSRIGYFTPKQLLQKNDPKPLVFIEQFKVFDIPYFEHDNLNYISDIHLTYRENFFTFNFGTIQHTNNQGIQYAYLLEGINPDWVITSDPIASYTNISDGEYFFRVRAKNWDNNWSDEKSILIHIQPPFWKTMTFYSLCFFSLLGLVYGVYRYRITQINEKNRIQQLALQSEVKALRAQMNPHFVFNALNSVKNNILSNKPLDAAEYLSDFAYLLRNILQQSRQKLITLKEDLETLKLYIQMEMGRFQQKFKFEYEIENDVPVESILIPPLILQPYAENAIRHAFNTKKENALLSLKVKMETINTILCIIEDNGSGRLQKSNSSSNHQSLGMSITDERIKLHNQLNDENIQVKIIDKFDGQQIPCGTRVEVRFTFDTN